MSKKKKKANVYSEPEMPGGELDTKHISSDLILILIGEKNDIYIHIVKGKTNICQLDPKHLVLQTEPHFYSSVSELSAI